MTRRYAYIMIAVAEEDLDGKVLEASIPPGIRTYVWAKGHGSMREMLLHIRQQARLHAKNRRAVDRRKS